jgi:PST family polysaccharide transporter
MSFEPSSTPDAGESASGASDDGALGTKALRGSLWNLVAFGMNKGAVLVTTVVVTRLLTTEEMGVWSLALVVLSYVDLFNEFGLGTAVIHHRDRSYRPADVAFGLSIVIGAVFSVVGFITAPLVAELLGAEELTGVLRLLSVVYVLASFYQVQHGLLARELQFQRRVGPEMARSITKAVVAIWLAAEGFGAYSLAWAQIAATIVGVVGYWIVTPWRPRPVFDFRLGRSLLGYGGQIVLIGLMGQAAQNVDYIFISREIGTAAVGIYTVAFRLPELAVLAVPLVVGQALISAYVRLRDQPEALAEALARTMRSVATVTVPIGVGLALVAYPLIEVLFGSRWAEAAPLLQVLAPATVLMALAFPVGDLLKAIGRPGMLNVMVFVRFAVAVLALWWAARQSLQTVAWVQLGIAAGWFVLNLGVARVVARLPLAAALRSIVPAAVGAVVMTGAVLALQRAGDPSVWVELGSATVVGVLSYGAVIWLLDRAWLFEMRDRLLTRSG